MTKPIGVKDATRYIKDYKKSAPNTKYTAGYWLQDIKWSSRSIGWPTDKDLDLYLY